MSIKLQLPKLSDLKPRITVVGVGGAGGNAVNNMIASGLTGVEFIVANTDAQALAASSAERRIQLGANLTEGLGAGSKPEIGQAAAEEALDEIRAHIAGSHMVFIAAGMGGGTGTGAAAVIARIARELGILTVGVVTKPFQFEGTRRMRAAEAGIAELKKHVDTLIVIPNQNLFRIANDRTTFADAFVLADQVLYSGVACIVDLIVKEGLINLDFADVRTIMSGMGTAMMGTGEASGDQRAIRAAEEAIANPLVDGVSLDGAKGLLLSIIGGPDMTLFEVDEAASRVRREVDPDANIIVGATFDDTMGDRIRVAIVASGMEALNTAAAAPARAPAFDPPSDVQAPRAQPARAQPPAIPGAAAAPPTAPPPAYPQRRSAFDILVAEATETDDRPAYLTAMPQSSPPPLPQAQTSRELWRAPGNVIIEEAPATMSAPAERRAPPSLASAPPAAVFSPAAPAEAARNARRVPDIGEFPAVGQREYNARNLLAAHANRPSPPAAGSASAQAAPERRGGLLDRLVGAGQNGPAQAGQNSGASASVAAQSSDAKASPPGRAMPFFFNRNKG